MTATPPTEADKVAAQTLGHAARISNIVNGPAASYGIGMRTFVGLSVMMSGGSAQEFAKLDGVLDKAHAGLVEKHGSVEKANIALAEFTPKGHSAQVESTALAMEPQLQQGVPTEGKGISKI